MGMRSGGQILVANLLAQRATLAFGVPGESYLAVLDALHDAAGRLRFVVCRHEGGAAYMAEACGKLTGRPGILFVTRGPGASNAAVGIHTAMQDSTPLIAFVGQVGTGMVDRDTVRLFQKAATSAADPDVKAFAGKMLPTLQHHLQMATELKTVAAKVGNAKAPHDRKQ